MNLIPTDWAMNHAPVANAVERAVLAALANSGNSDGCNASRSTKRLAAVACTTPDIVKKTCRDLQTRGFIRRQDTDTWEVMVPADFWSPAQLEDVNRDRADHGLRRITVKTRPPFGGPRPAIPPRCDDPRHDQDAHPNVRLLCNEDGTWFPCPRCHPAALAAGASTDA